MSVHLGFDLGRFSGRCILIASVVMLGCGPSSPPSPSAERARVGRAPSVAGTGSCLLDPGRTDRVDLALFVAGLNHAEPANRPVGQRGVDHFADFIAADLRRPGAPSADSLVIAFTGNMPAPEPCDSGGVLARGETQHNGHCLVHALQQRLGLRFSMHYRDVWEHTSAGNAVLTGSRWVVEEFDHGRTPSGFNALLGVRLHDSTRPRNAPGSSFWLYVVHTSVNEVALPEVREMVDLAMTRARSRPADLPPMFVGDFNTPTCPDGTTCRAADPGVAPEFAAFVSANLIFVDAGLTCPVQAGIATPLTFLLETDKMHVLSGARSGPTSFACSPARFLAVRLSYSVDGAGQPSNLRQGIDLPDVDHNVVGLGLEIVQEAAPQCGPNQRCEAGACVPRCDCTRPRGEGAACGRSDGCGNACRCLSNHECVRGVCREQGVSCGGLTCPAAQACCRGECCSPGERCTIRGCE